MSFVAAGGGPPLDSDYDWLVTIGPSSDGLALQATPVGRAPPAQVVVRLSGVTRWEVRVLAPRGSQWLEEWPKTTVMPRAVAIRFWHDSEPIGLPLHVVRSLAQPIAASGEDAAP